MPQSFLFFIVAVEKNRLFLSLFQCDGDAALGLHRIVIGPLQEERFFFPLEVFRVLPFIALFSKLTKTLPFAPPFPFLHSCTKHSWQARIVGLRRPRSFLFPLTFFVFFRADVTPSAPWPRRLGPLRHLANNPLMSRKSARCNDMVKTVQ